MGDATPYCPLILCDSCHRPQRHTPSGTADVPQFFFDREFGRCIESGEVISVELWRCLECCNERVYGSRRD